MPNYIRNQVYGGTYFFTLVTYQRKPIFSDKTKVDLLLKSIQQTQIRKPFDLIAYCVLFDHLHLLMALPIDDRSFSQIIRTVKRTTTNEIHKQPGQPKLTIWQDRFWEHTIRDEDDLKHHFDYIHYNPVKHGYVEDYADWIWSSYHWYLDVDPRMIKINSKQFEDAKNSYGE